MNKLAGALKRSSVNDSINQPESTGTLLKATAVKKVVEKHQEEPSKKPATPVKKVAKTKKVKETTDVN